MDRPDFIDIVLNNMTSLEAVTYYYIPKSSFLFKMKVAGEKDDDFWRDEETYKHECRMNDQIDARYMESDIEEVSALSPSCSTFLD